VPVPWLLPVVAGAVVGSVTTRIVDRALAERGELGDAGVVDDVRYYGTGSVRPSFNGLPLDEAAVLLGGVFEVDRFQIRSGRAPVGVIAALAPDRRGRRRLRYQRIDKNEVWRTNRDVWKYGGGDCEDLAAAAAAELVEVYGVPAAPMIYRVRPGLAHAVVRLGDGRIFDPSRLGGMGQP
jgi:hypothetical protein